VTPKTGSVLSISSGPPKALLNGFRGAPTLIFLPAGLPKVVFGHVLSDFAASAPTHSQPKGGKAEAPAERGSSAGPAW
jgi:hypothetical protein